MSAVCKFVTDRELDPLDPELVNITTLGKSLPDPPSRQVLWRWTHKGVRGVVLRTVRIGRRSYSTPTEFRAFLRGIQRQKGGAPNVEN